MPAPAVPAAKVAAGAATATESKASTSAEPSADKAAKKGGKAKAEEGAAAEAEKKVATEAEELAAAEVENKEAHKGSHFHQKRLLQGKLAEAPKPEQEGFKTVYVGNLDWSVEEPQLYRIFGDVDGLKDVRLVRDFLKRSKGFAYIDFDTKEHVDEAVKKFNGHLINNRGMKVAPSLPTRPLFEEKVLFVKNIGGPALESDVRAAFASFGEIAGVRMPMVGEGESLKHKGYAYVDFAEASSVDAAMASKEDVKLGGQTVEIVRSIPMKDHRHHTAANRKDIPQRANQRLIVEGKLDREDPMRLSSQFSNTVYVKNLAFHVTDDFLRRHFSSCGEVTQVLICRNEQGRSQGFAFVEFKNDTDAQGALLLTECVLKGRKIVVSQSTRAITEKNPEKKDRPDKPAEPTARAAPASASGAPSGPAANAAAAAPKAAAATEKGKNKGAGKGYKAPQAVAVAAGGAAAPVAPQGAAAPEAAPSGSTALAPATRFALPQAARAAGKRRLDLGGDAKPVAEGAAARAAAAGEAEEPVAKAQKTGKVAFRDVKALKGKDSDAKDSETPVAQVPVVEPTPAPSEEAAAESTKPLSNSDFRALFLAGVAAKK